jgi:hypothetical protein
MVLKFYRDPDYKAKLGQGKGLMKRVSELCFRGFAKNTGRVSGGG